MDRDTAFSVFESLIICIAAVFVLLGTYARSFGDPAYSRLATVLSLTKFGTWYIDRPLTEEPNRFEQRTIDKVMVNGHLLSSKPPLLPLLMAGEYLAINHLAGWSLENDRDTDQILRIMAMTFMGLPYLLTLIFFAKSLQFVMSDAVGRAVALFALAFGTQLWGYSTNINNHVPGACAVMIALYLALGMGSGHLPLSPARFFYFGLAAGLVPTLDMPATIFALPAALYLLVKFPKPTLTWATAGALLPVGAHLAIMVAVTGSPLPVQLRRDLYWYEGSFWRHPRGIDALTEPKGAYFFNMTFGRNGLFSLFPILLLGIVAAVRAIFRPASPLRGHILAGLVSFSILTAYYALNTSNYGGEAYGFRWFICAMPVLLLMGAPVLSGLRRRWQWIFIGLMLG
ncbi:MAG: hypothetical protein HY706_18145, partial [Candidatus Hydrogenedentes bacterium]|nr:hypothetical protein [Candidatus Hydrogenedentota bacterium]